MLYKLFLVPCIDRRRNMQKYFKKYFHSQPPFTCMVRVVNRWLTKSREKEKQNEISKMTQIFYLIDFDTKFH